MFEEMFKETCKEYLNIASFIIIPMEPGCFTRDRISQRRNVSYNYIIKIPAVEAAIAAQITNRVSSFDI